jgi:hypothetical protein
MYRSPERGEALKAPSKLFKSEAAEVAARSFLLHRKPEQRDGFRRQLAEALEDADKSPSVIAGLKEAGLISIAVEGKSRIFIRGLALSNPDPEEFSTRVLGALSSTNQDPVEVLAEQGQQLLDDPDKVSEVNEWMEGIEVAIRNG